VLPPSLRKPAMKARRMDDPARLTGKDQLLRLVRGLALRSRLDRALRRGTAGLFYGLLPGIVAAGIAGTIALPMPAVVVAACCAVIGLLAGAAAGLLPKVDEKRLLLRADRVLGSKELAATALELAAAGDDSPFPRAIIEDAADLLSRSPPRNILGRPRLPFAPFLPVCAGLIVAALLLPFDLRSLLPRDGRQDVLDVIGDDLREYGDRLKDAARAEELGRNLALAQELAQLGEDLSSRSLSEEEALERMSDLEARMAQAYQSQELESLGETGETGSDGEPGKPSSGQPGQGTPRIGSGDEGTDQNLKDLSEMLQRLRQAKDSLAPGSQQGQEGTATAQAPSQGGQSGTQPDEGTPPSDASGQDRQQQGSSGSRSPGGDDEESGESSTSGSAPGTTPAPQKTGEPTDIAQGGTGPGLRAQGQADAGELTRLLARALPGTSSGQQGGAAVLNGYARQVESALARDEVPLTLKEYVKGYFTIIGMSTDSSGR
jgi:hypothetical protein